MLPILCFPAADHLKLKRLRVRFIKKVNLLALLNVEFGPGHLDLNIVGKFTRALNARLELQHSTKYMSEMPVRPPHCSSLLLAFKMNILRPL
jgi:hypothetical protein